MMNQKHLLPILLVPTCIVTIPVAAMLLKADGWAWNAADFVIAWVGIAIAVAAYKFVASRAPNRAYRMASGVAVTTGIILKVLVDTYGVLPPEIVETVLPEGSPEP